MAEALERKLRAIRLRSGANRLLVHAAVVLAGAGALVALALLAERLFSVTVVGLWTVGGLFAAAVVLLVALSWLRMPGRMQVALLVDDRLAFRERFSTTLALAASDDPFALAASREAHQAAETLNVAGRFPIRPSGHWLATLAAWLVAAAVFAFMPDVDLLGTLARRREHDRRAARIEEARAQVEEATAKVKAAVEQVRSKPLAGDLADLGELLKGGEPAAMRREAIRKLGNLTDKLKEMEQSGQAQAIDGLRKMLKNLRDSPSALNNELNRAIANGDFGAASKMLGDLMRKLNEEKLTDEQKKALAEQLKNLSEQLAELGDSQKQCENALRQEGMDGATAKKLAGLSEKDLREELKKRGMTDEQIDKMMEKLQAARKACGNCTGLGKSLAECLGKTGELLPDGLVGLIEGIEGLEGQALERASLEEALKEIDRAVALLGDGQCGESPGDPNAVGLWQAGEGDMVGRGRGGGRGRAWGQRPVGDPEQTGVKKTGVKNKPTKDREIIASWLFKGPQAKGVSKRKLAEVTRAAKDAAAEAIRDNKVPRKYENAVKRYFGGFDKTFRPDANQP